MASVSVRLCRSNRDAGKPVSDQRNSASELERFAIRVEEKLRNSSSASTIENLVCRALTNKKNPLIAAKWVEWRYGKARETIRHEGTVTHEHFDASKLTDEQLGQAEQLVESASVGSDSE